MVQVGVLRMKISETNENLNKLLRFFIKILAILCIALATCGALNFILIPTLDTSVVGISMIDANSQKENIDVMMMGTSRTYRGVDAPYLSEKLNENVFDIVSNSVTYISLYHLLIELCKTNEPEKVFIEVSSVNFKRDMGTEEMYIYHFLTGQNQKDYGDAVSLDYEERGLFEFTNYLRNFANGKFVENIRFKVDPVPLGSTDYWDNCTYMGKGFSSADATCDGKNLDLPGAYLTNGDAWEEEDVNEKALEYFYKIIDYCNEHNIEVILYSLPYPKVIIEKYFEDFVQFDNSLHSYIENYDNLIYLDFSKIREEYMELSTDYFYNANHCNGLGAEKIAPIFLDIYREIENNTYSYDKWFYNDFGQLFENSDV